MPNRSAVVAAAFVIISPLAVGFLIWKALQVTPPAITSHGLEISAGLTSQTIPLEELHLDQARIVSLADERTLQPVERIAGTAVSNYAAGWFRLRNGEKALLVIHKTDRVLYIPTQRDYVLLLGIGDLDALLGELRDSTFSYSAEGWRALGAGEWSLRHPAAEFRSKGLMVRKDSSQVSAALEVWSTSECDLVVNGATLTSLGVNHPGMRLRWGSRTGIIAASGSGKVTVLWDLGKLPGEALGRTITIRWNLTCAEDNFDVLFQAVKSKG